MAQQRKQNNEAGKVGRGKSERAAAQVAAMKPGDAGRKAKQMLNDGKISFHQGHLSWHIGEQYQDHVFDVQDIYKCSDGFHRKSHQGSRILSSESESVHL